MAKAKQCVRCGSKENLWTRSDYWNLISESEHLLKIYETVDAEEGHDKFNMTSDDRICCGCMSDEIVGWLCDGLDMSDEVKIRREYKKDFESDVGDLYDILNEALQFSCFGCGGGMFKVIPVKQLSEERKKKARKILRDYAATLKETGGVVNICPKCEELLE